MCIYLYINVYILSMHASAHSPKRRYCVLSLTRALDANASRHYAPASSQERRTTVRPGAAERNNAIPTTKGNEHSYGSTSTRRVRGRRS